MIHIAHDGTQHLLIPQAENITQNHSSYESRYIQAQGSLPNGICFDQNGDFIIANWGTNCLERVTREGPKKLKIY